MDGSQDLGQSQRALQNGTIIEINERINNLIMIASFE